MITAMTCKVIIVHALEHARAALAAAADLGVPVVLASAPDAAGYAGVLWFRALLREAAEAYPDVEATGLLDCGDRPGFALAAIRLGLPAVCFRGPAAVAKKLAAIAETEGVRLVRDVPDALDLRFETDPENAARHWLSAP